VLFFWVLEPRQLRVVPVVWTWLLQVLLLLVLLLVPPLFVYPSTLVALLPLLLLHLLLLLVWTMAVVPGFLVLRLGPVSVLSLLSSLVLLSELL
jgi:hypothetical protein